MAAERDSLQTILSRDSGSASEVDKSSAWEVDLHGRKDGSALIYGEKENSPAMNVFDRLGPVGNKKGTSILDYWETLNKKKEEVHNNYYTSSKDCRFRVVRAHRRRIVGARFSAQHCGLS
eukprot:1391648-Amorphochlora_amoeboformis.AAC.2